MFGALANIFGSGGGGLAGLFGGGGSDPGKKQLKQILGIYKQLQSGQSSLYANALQQQKKGLGAITTGFGNAQKAVGNSGYAAKSSILGREKQNLGTLQQGLTSSGLGSTSVTQNLQRGVYSDTNRSLSQVDEQLAQIRSSLFAQQAALEANQYGALAGIFQGQAGAQTGLGQSLIGTLGSVQHPDPNAGLNSLLQFGGQLGMASIFASDRRLKRDIVALGGGEYEFSYRGLPGRYRGVMADEWPDATMWRDGYAWVDYSRVPVKFRRVA